MKGEEKRRAPKYYLNSNPGEGKGNHSNDLEMKPQRKG
jgi:hypothetical protein